MSRKQPPDLHPVGADAVEDGRYRGSVAFDQARTFGPLQKPAYLEGAASRAWDQYVTPYCGHLDRGFELAAVAYVMLFTEFLRSPRDFPASKISAMRAWARTLGLSPERRGGPRVARRRP